jgi:hypothetical protein
MPSVSNRSASARSPSDAKAGIAPRLRSRRPGASSLSGGAAAGALELADAEENGGTRGAAGRGGAACGRLVPLAGRMLPLAGTGPSALDDSCHPHLSSVGAPAIQLKNKDGTKLKNLPGNPRTCERDWLDCAKTRGEKARGRAKRSFSELKFPTRASARPVCLLAFRLLAVVASLPNHKKTHNSQQELPPKFAHGVTITRKCQIASKNGQQEMAK